MAEELIIIGEVNNPEWVAAFGKFQKVYQQEDGVNATEVAKNMLRGVERTGNVQALGNIYCITGYSVGIKDPYTGLIGQFQIDSDVHTWENGNHTMTLSLNFDDIMDEKTYRSKAPKASQTVLQWSDDK